MGLSIAKIFDKLRAGGEGDPGAEAPEVFRPVAVCRDWIAGKFHLHTISVAAAFLAALMTSFASSGGLFLTWSEIWVALLLGAVAGMIAPGPGASAGAAACASFLGALIGPKNLWHGPEAAEFNPGLALCLAGVAAIVAAGVSSVANRKHVRDAITWISILFIVGSMWALPLQVDRESLLDIETSRLQPSFFEQLKGDIPPKLEDTDDAFYLKVLGAVQAGTPFYEAFVSQSAMHYKKEDNPVLGPLNVRFPLIFLFWASLPTRDSIVYSYLVLLSLALLCMPLMLRDTVSIPFVIPGAVALASYGLHNSLQLTLLYPDSWAGLLIVGSLAFWGLSVGGKRWQVWAVCSAITGLLAVLVREIVVFAPVAGLVAAFAAGGRRRRWSVIVWGVALGSFTMAYAVHMTMAYRVVPGDSLSGQAFHGGFEYMWAGLTTGWNMFGLLRWVVALLALTGLAGMIAVTDRQFRIFAVLAVVAPLAAFLFVGNDAHDSSGNLSNYWGLTVVPTLLAFSPAFFAWLPGMNLKRSDSALPDSVKKQAVD